MNERPEAERNSTDHGDSTDDRSAANTEDKHADAETVAATEDKHADAETVAATEDKHADAETDTDPE
ncbi:MAG: hypothetical protein M3Y91_04595, partial [Actinomycetota bacterium]|nr:hypothetical protein [Actinomycetota bacterium]